MPVFAAATLATCGGLGYACYRYLDGPKRRKLGPRKLLDLRKPRRCGEEHDDQGTLHQKTDCQDVTDIHKDAEMLTDIASSKGDQKTLHYDKLNFDDDTNILAERGFVDLVIGTGASKKSSELFGNPSYVSSDTFLANEEALAKFSIDDDDDCLLDLDVDPVAPAEAVAESAALLSGEVSNRQKVLPATSFKSRPAHDKRQDYIEGIYNAKC